MPHSFTTLLASNFRPKILLVGDVMLDRYLWGDVERISPEAPIPILRVSKREHRLGGAGSVATMLAALGAEIVLATMVGDDTEGRRVRKLLEGIGVGDHCVVVDPDRPTTVKERLLGRAQQRHPHHMMRVDREDCRPISEELARQFLVNVEHHLDQVDLVLVSDYNKGICAGQMIPQIVHFARSAGVRVVADPVRDADYHRYAGCECITPNRIEAGLAVRMKILTPQDGLEAAQRLLRFGIQAAMVTLDRDGIAWADQAGNARLFPGKPRQVCDITGAGDMVLSTVGYCLAAGADYPTTIEIANAAGGLEVEQLGVVPFTRRQIHAELGRARAGNGPAESKILSREQITERLEPLRQARQRIVMTNGCFDLLHPGHVASLQHARRQGDCLVVGLNSDRSVRENKGPTRPIIDQQGRAEMLAALACVDYVVIFDEASVEGLIEQIQPDVLVKSAQYSLDGVVGHKVVESYGGHVVTVPMRPNYSTSGMIEKIRRLPPRSVRKAS